MSYNKALIVICIIALIGVGLYYGGVFESLGLFALFNPGDVIFRTNAINDNYIVNNSWIVIDTNEDGILESHGVSTNSYANDCTIYAGLDKINIGKTTNGFNIYKSPNFFSEGWIYIDKPNNCVMANLLPYTFQDSTGGCGPIQTPAIFCYLFVGPNGLNPITTIVPTEPYTSNNQEVVYQVPTPTCSEVIDSSTGKVVFRTNAVDGDYGTIYDWYSGDRHWIVLFDGITPYIYIIDNRDPNCIPGNILFGTDPFNKWNIYYYDIVGSWTVNFIDKNCPSVMDGITWAKVSNGYENPIGTGVLNADTSSTPNPSCTQTYTTLCNNNGICESGEDINNCPNDCLNDDYETCTSPSECQSDYCTDGICTPYPQNPKQLKITISNPNTVGNLDANVKITSISSTNSYVNSKIQNIVNDEKLIIKGGSYIWNSNPIDLSLLADGSYQITGTICAVETPDLPFINELCNPFSGSFNIAGGQSV